jgi:p-hydroxybenzoate 3-monooxygenase
MRTQVAIIGAGPSGLLLSQLLNRAGIATVVLERQSRDHVLSRIRAGVLEWGTTELLRAAGVGERMDSEGKPHDHIHFAVNKHLFKVDCHALTGRRLMVYGQTEVTTDLYAAQDAMGATIIHDAADVVLHDVTSDQPRVTWVKDGQSHDDQDKPGQRGGKAFQNLDQPCPKSVIRQFPPPTSSPPAGQQGSTKRPRLRTRQSPRRR